MTPVVGFAPERVPSALREVARWVLWRYEQKNGEITKIPKTLDDRNASSTDPSTWATFTEAVEGMERLERACGPGFVFTEEDQLSGVDLDECIGEDGEIVVAAQQIIAEFDTYTEISPSGRGVKLFLRGRKPDGAGCKSKVIPGFKQTEVYDRGRYFCVTGRHVPGTPLTVEYRQRELESLCSRLWPKTDRGPQRASPMTDSHDFDDSDDTAQRAAAYLDAMPPAVSGQGGHDRTYAAAVAMVHGFALRPEVALRLLLERFNPRCVPPWSDGELRHKVEDAATKSHDRPRGWLRDHRLFHLTDIGNADRLSLRHGHDLRYCKLIGWLRWDGRRWARDETGGVQEFAKATALSVYEEAASERDENRRKTLAVWATKSESAPRVAAMQLLAQSDPAIAVRADQLDADPWAINVMNGIVDLRTGTLRPHDPAALHTKLAPVAFDPAATCPIFDRFLLETTRNRTALIRYLIQFFGMCLTGDIRTQVFPVFYGTGENGKNTLIDTIMEIMGDYADKAAPELLVAKKWTGHPTEIADLRGKRLVVASETEKGQQLRVSFMKEMTGDSKMKGRKMREDFPQGFARTHKTILVTNNKPVIVERTHAVWRRVQLIPFDHVVTPEQRDETLIEKLLLAEGPGILAMLVRGCLDWQANGLIVPEEVKAATTKYRVESDHLAQFAEACLTLDERAWMPSKSLRETFEPWCGENGVRPDMGDLRGWLRDKGCKPKPTRDGRGWAGVRLKTLEEAS